jgi:two-component system, OmpR family, sensor histidine kinase KdpD
VNWGRYAELYAYDATRGLIIREEHGIGASLADHPGPARRGTLHLHLGAAPGSGKTFTMLRDGRALRDHGEDVVVGFAQARGRPRTAEALRGLEIVPARQVPAGRGSGVADRVGGAADGGPASTAPVREEMDLDAVLDRKPAVVLVDDYGAHISAIGTLRDAGIDVISTVDVSDLERAAPEIRQLTGLSPSATVSDAALAEADEIRFLDNSPEALRKRLGHGNIYPPEQAAAALEGLFTTANLAAMRELGLRVVADTLTGPGRARQRGPLDVLVAVTDPAQVSPAQAGALIRRGARLARQGHATCTVLALAPAARASDDWTAAVRAAAHAAGAAVVIIRAGRDPAAAIAHAVRETGARHLVMAAPLAGRLERWRPGLAERLASLLPDVHLHLLAGQARPATGGPDGADSLAAAAPRPTRGAIRVYLGYAAGCGITSAMLEEAGRRRSRGADVVVATVDCRGREAVNAALEGLEVIGDGTSLDTNAVLVRHPEVVCIDDLSATDASGVSRFTAARRLADASITVVATVHLDHLRDGGADADGAAPDGAAANGAARDSTAVNTLDEEGVLALADEIELVDAPPSVLADRVKRGEIIPAAQAGPALPADYSTEVLAAQREQAFAVVAKHADRRLAGYRDSVRSEARPRILGCAAPRAGLEPLIRRSAARAAQLAGDFLIAVVTPASPSPGPESVVAGYEALTTQLGGQFATLPGRPADALARFARQHQVTEILLARDPAARDGRHRLLSELARRAGDAEVHLLPAQAA